MSGDSLNPDKSAGFTQSDGNPPQGAVEFGVDLPKPHNQIQATANKNVLQVRPPQPYRVTPVSVDDRISSVSAPVGWRISLPPAAKAGENVFHVKDGVNFVQPNDASAKIHVGPALDLNRVDWQTESAFRQLAKAMPATNGPQELTPAEIKSISGMIPAFKGRNNQYDPGGDIGPRYNITDASTIDVNGKTGLMIKGSFEGDGSTPGVATESIYFDNAGTTDVVSLSAPQDKIKQYDQELLDTAKSIKWK